ncbi:MAG: Membrane-bound lytic murein transglycosylase D precursor [Bacteroidetes bacterium ADurb.BinA245]|nr:MAG: Membrane-bound lytic murein transglycosylase D precursor [Bacteroidetes bacterium ADurb.BinA245]HND95145.1 lytic transglycosylase domain-containing protein [Chitinophagaceae bacterium]HNL59191.1 lytic transglycosylase domain-containing protein [Chitinophagaceae bacterium]
MLNRKFYIAGFIIVCVALVAAASEKLQPVIIQKTLIDTTALHKEAVHHFDSNGVCTCIPASAADDIDDIPRLSLNKNVAEFVKKYNAKNGLYLDKAKAKTEKYFQIVDSVLRLNEVPAELKYLAFIESGMQKNPVTHTGAIGPWALMPKAAQQYGLKIGRNDERLNYAKSTAAAAALMKDMYADYQDWIMVIAAYNCGPGTMERAIRKAGTTDYWSVQKYLPEETRRHTQKFIAVHYHFEGNGSAVTMTKADMENHIKAVAAYVAGQQAPHNDDTLVVSAKK